MSMYSTFITTIKLHNVVTENYRIVIWLVSSRDRPTIIIIIIIMRGNYISIADIECDLRACWAGERYCVTIDETNSRTDWLHNKKFNPRNRN